MQAENKVYALENKYNVMGIDSKLPRTWYLTDEDKKGVVIYVPTLKMGHGFIGLTIQEAKTIAEELQGLIEVMDA